MHRPEVACPRVRAAHLLHMRAAMTTPPRAFKAEAAISEIMSRIVITVSPRVTVDRLSRLLDEHSIRGAPVVNADGKPMGMVTKTDEARARHRHQLVREVMSMVAVAVPETSSVPDAAALLCRHRVDRAPVVNARGAITGIFTSRDIERWMTGHRNAHRPGFGRTSGKPEERS